VQNGKNGLNGETLTRLVYEDGSGVHQVATLQDGLKFGGDTGDVINRQVREAPERQGIFGEMILEFLPAAHLGLDPKGTEELAARPVKVSKGKLEGITEDFNGYRIDVYAEEGRKAKRDFYFLVADGLDQVYRVKEGKAVLLYRES
ncbi:MAG: hypothetical protein IJ694_00470, partial [Acidaminococcaceae bacterium]|nr:hypothetical protein [Acidaminococcaceae bacterium]